MTTIIGITLAAGAVSVFAAIVAGVWQMAGDAVAQGDDPTGKENVGE